VDACEMARIGSTFEAGPWKEDRIRDDAPPTRRSTDCWGGAPYFAQPSRLRRIKPPSQVSRGLGIPTTANARMGVPAVGQPPESLTVE
jgi:hypothetical protein